MSGHSPTVKSTSDMERVDYLTAQKYLPRTMRRVCETDQAVTIDGAGKDQVVMLSKKQYDALLALAPLPPAMPQRNPCNAPQVEPEESM